MNISIVNDDVTARTHPDCAHQRAENLAILSVKHVIELCVGPSLKTLESAYSKHNITVTGNDIDKRWKNYHQAGNWIIGDALKIDVSQFDAVVFAPPLSKGCTGKRAHSLSVDDVFPKYQTFLSSVKNYTGLIVLTLPARSFATSYDRKQTHALLSSICHELEIVPLVSGRRKITKYYDVYYKSLCSRW